MYKNHGHQFFLFLFIFESFLPWFINFLSVGNLTSPLTYHTWWWWLSTNHCGLFYLTTMMIDQLSFPIQFISLYVYFCSDFLFAICFIFYPLPGSMVNCCVERWVSFLAIFLFISVLNSCRIPPTPSWISLYTACFLSPNLDPPIANNNKNHPPKAGGKWMCSLGGAMVSTIVREKIVCVWHIFMLYSNFTITHFWPTSLVPFFLNHWKKRIANPPKSCHLILKCRPLHEVVFNFCNAVAWGQH